MRAKFKIISFFLFIFFMLIIPNNAIAVDINIGSDSSILPGNTIKPIVPTRETTSVCVNGRQYSATWSSTLCPNLDLSSFTYTAASLSGEVSIVDKNNQTCSVFFTDAGTSCTTTGTGGESGSGDSGSGNSGSGDSGSGSGGSTEFVSCPTSEQASTYTFGSLKNNIEKQFIPSTGQYKVTITDIWNGKLQVRKGTYVTSGGTGEDFGKASDFNDFITLSSGKFTFYASIGEKMTLLFYLNGTTTCSGEYFGSYDLVMPKESEIEIDNPIKDVKDGICDEVRNAEIIPETYKESVIYECYDSKLKYAEAKDIEALKNRVKSKLDTAKKLFEDFTPNVTLDGETSCTNSKTVQHNFTPYSGQYFRVDCTESLTATGSTPKLVRAGAGFTYGATYELTRICHVTQVSQAVKPPQCECDVSCNGGPYNEVDEDSAGPNEDFDSCVNSCDGGSYTQDCINSCYNEVYGSDSTRKMSITSDKSLSFLTQNYNNKVLIKRINSDGNDGGTDNLPGGSSVDITSNSQCSGESSVGGPHNTYGKSCSVCGGTLSFWYSYGCNNPPTVCTVSSGPSGCFWDPEAEYQRRLKAAESEYNAAQAIANSYKKTGHLFSYKIVDSYLKTENNNKSYVYTINENDNPKVGVNWSSGGVTTVSSRSYALGNSGGKSVTATSTKATQKFVTSLPQAYTSRIDGNPLYTSDNKYYSLNLKNGGFNLYTGSLNRFYKGGLKYYTNLNSGNYNVDLSKTKVTLKHEGDNILVNGKNLGYNNELSISIDCYYGVYNDTVCTKQEECPSPSPSPCVGENCGSVDSTGIQFIFRPIELTDVFPNNRNARWNWTSDAIPSTEIYNYLNYKVSPVTLTEKIQNDGLDIYSDAGEVDYEFNLTPQNIQNIRAYNKEVSDINKDGSRNYLDYDMTCGTKNGRDYCYSKLMSNVKRNYITYVGNFNVTSRENIAICNNTYNQNCKEY